MEGWGAGRVGDGRRLLGLPRGIHIPQGLVTRQAWLVGPGRLGSLSVWEVARALSGLTVKDVMIKAMRVITTGQDTPVEEAARVMVERKMGCLPVADGGWQMATISYQFSARGGASWPAVASLRARRGKWDAVVKRAVSQEQMVAALGRPRGIHIPQGRVEGQQIIDVREIR